MKLNEYWRGLTDEEREDFVVRAGTTLGYMPLLLGGHRQPSPKMAKRLSTASAGEILLHELRPDIWSDRATT